MVIESIKDLEYAVSSLADGEAIEICTLYFTHEAQQRLKYYIADKVLLFPKGELDGLDLDYREKVKNGDCLIYKAKYVKAYSAQYIADRVESSFAPIINHYKTRDLEHAAKIDELQTQLLQYQTYVADLTTTIQKHICKDFCPNIKPTTEKRC